MTVLNAIRDRFSPSAPSTSAREPSTSARDALPFAGYDRLDDRQVVDGLSDHSQIELEAAEGYERSHKDREPVLDKLRFMRQREPLPGYDALSVKQVVAALQDADLATIKKVRGYERKFANRRDVLEEVVRVHHVRRASQPASAAPSYQPISATSASSAPVDRPERSGRQ
jgi:hypothetical protein